MADRAPTKTYLETVLRAEIDRALALGTASHLQSLERIRDAAGIAPDPCLTEWLEENFVTAAAPDAAAVRGRAA